MITLDTANNALKAVYLGVISHNFNYTIDPLLAKIRHTTKDVYGNQIVKGVTIDGEYLVFKEDLESIFATVDISDKAIRCSQNSAGAFVDLLNSEIESMIKLSSHKLVSAFYTEDVKPNYLPKEMTYVPLKINGLKKLFDTESDTLYGLNRKEVKELNPVIETIDKFDPMKIQEIIDNYNDEVDVIVCSSKIKREYMEYLSDHRQNIEILELQGGFKCVKFNNILTMIQAKIPDNEIYLLNTKDFNFHQLCDWQWLENSQGEILQQLNGYPLYRATLVKYGNYICDQPNRQIKVIVKNEHTTDKDTETT